MVRVVDDFLPMDVFKQMSDWIMGEDITWRYAPIIDDDDRYSQYCHIVYKDDIPYSDQFNQFNQTFADRLSVQSWVRIKVNSKVRTERLIEYPLHYDDPCEKIAFFNVNTCNGYTYFEDHEPVPSIANRMILFRRDMKHGGTTTSNVNRRIGINFNYY